MMIMSSKMKVYLGYIVTGLDYLFWAALFGLLTYVQWLFGGMVLMHISIV